MPPKYGQGLLLWSDSGLGPSDQIVLQECWTDKRERKIFLEKTFDLTKVCYIVRSCEASRPQLLQIFIDLTIHRPDESGYQPSEKHARKGVAGGGTQRISSGNIGSSGQSFLDCAWWGRDM